VACCDSEYGNVSLWKVVVAESQHLRKASLYQECLFQKGRDLIELICNKLLPGPPKRIQRISLDFVDIYTIFEHDAPILCLSCKALKKFQASKGPPNPNQLAGQFNFATPTEKITILCVPTGPVERWA